MADTYSYITPQRLGSQLVPPNHENPNKFLTNFMYKAVLTAIFLFVLPLLPPQPPQFISQTLHTRSWELFQLLFVGIAVCYGLFSRRNDETAEHSSKFDNVHLFMSKFLQISSVFDDETDSLYGYDENKVQTRNSQYYRSEPVVVAQENSVLEEQRGDSSWFGEKPLLLPIQSLKSRASDSEFAEETSDSSCSAGFLSSYGSSSGSKRFSNNSIKHRNVEFGGSNPLDLDEKVEENVAFCSSIPWRSRSGRMEIKQEMDHVPLFSLPPSIEEYEFNHLESRLPQTSQSYNPIYTYPLQSLSSSENPSPSRSFSTQSQAKNVEKVARKKIYYESSPPPPPAPPPPPPPPLFVPKAPLVKTNSSPSNAENFSEKKLRRNIWNDREELLNRASSGAEPAFEDGIVETDDDSESEDDVFEEEDSGSEEVDSNSVVGDGGPDVDKKADEFIAKFREQIRIQRTIKRSTGQISRCSSK